MSRTGLKRRRLPSGGPERREFSGVRQDPNPATPTEVIFARKTLMNSIATNMYPIDGMLETGRLISALVAYTESPSRRC